MANCIKSTPKDILGETKGKKGIIKKLGDGIMRYKWHFKQNGFSLNNGNTTKHVRGFYKP